MVVVVNRRKGVMTIPIFKSRDGFFRMFGEGRSIYGAGAGVRIGV